MFHSAYEDLLKCLQLPSGIKLPVAPSAIGSGSYFLIPAFFRLLLNLRAQGRDFALVFRTFGTDLPEVPVPIPFLIRTRRNGGTSLGYIGQAP